jgi:hypothetical protein
LAELKASKKYAGCDPILQATQRLQATRKLQTIELNSLINILMNKQKALDPTKQVINCHS